VRSTAAAIQAYGDLLTASVQADLLGPDRPHGIFLSSCEYHCGMWGDIVIDGDNAASALMKWYSTIGQQGAKTFWNQNQPYPCTACCHP
jgi:hypothetical protein